MALEHAFIACLYLGFSKLLNAQNAGCGLASPDCGLVVPNTTIAPIAPESNTANPSNPSGVIRVSLCPSGSQALRDPNGRPVKCLPHHTDLCGSQSCCFYNKVDYHCCPGVAQTDCPNYADATVVIYRRDGFNPNKYPPASPEYPPNLYDSIFGRPPGPKPGSFDGHYGLSGPYQQYPGQPGPPINLQPNQGPYKIGRAVAPVQLRQKKADSIGERQIWMRFRRGRL